MIRARLGNRARFLSFPRMNILNLIAIIGVLGAYWILFHD